ncbi:hypothetical protein Tco_1329775 [Tanacetum coccineum]
MSEWSHLCHRGRDFKVIIDVIKKLYCFKASQSMLKSCNLMQKFCKTTSNDRLRKSRINILWGMFYWENVDYPELIWEDLAFQIDYRQLKKGRRENMAYLRFTRRDEESLQGKKNAKYYKETIEMISSFLIPDIARKPATEDYQNTSAADTMKALQRKVRKTSRDSQDHVKRAIRKLELRTVSIYYTSQTRTIFIVARLAAFLEKVSSYKKQVGASIFEESLFFYNLLNALANDIMNIEM